MDEMLQRIEAFIRTETDQAASITELIPLAGGASRDTWIVIGTLDNEPIQLVLRRDLETAIIESALERDQEFLVIKAAYESGVKVPRPRWYCTIPAVLGKPFFMMDFAEGVSIGPKVVRAPELQAARQQLPRILGEQLAAIHAIDTHTLPFLQRPASGQSPAQAAVADLRAMVDQLGIHNPTIEFGIRWAAKHAPACDDLTLIHGDYRVGNLLITPDGLNAIIDWEFAHIGDPHEDLAWPCVRDWRFGNTHLRFGGIADREPFLQAYEQASGRHINRQSVDYWEMLGNLRWAMTCLSQANRHLSGGDPSVEFASLGRRSAEMQMEMLTLIQNWSQ